MTRGPQKSPLRRNGQREVLLRSKSGLRAILCIQDPLPEHARHIIVPTRVYSSQAAKPFESAELVSIAYVQCQNLVNKVQLLSKLFSEVRDYSGYFAIGRLLVLSSPTVSEQRAWKFAGEAIAETEQLLGLRAVSQPDYDQRMYQHTFTSYYDSIPLQAIHEPTARGTVLAFAAACKLSNVEFSHSDFGILGIGNLGRRIASKLFSLGISRIIVYDNDRSKVAGYLAREKYEVTSSFQELCESAPQGLIMCANSGSLSRETARIIVRQRAIRVVGGPEAGLDHDIEALRILDKAKLHFVPSMLCGALGLAAVLEEALESQPRLRILEARFSEFLERVIEEGRTSRLLFHRAFRTLVVSHMSENSAQTKVL